MIVGIIRIAIGGIIGAALIAGGLFLLFGPGTITPAGIVLVLILLGSGGAVCFLLFKHWKEAFDARSELEDRKIKAYFRSTDGRIKTSLAAVGGLALLIASLAVPRSAEHTFTIYERGLEGGPDSYFHHIYDPQHLLGPLGHVDLELDNFQRASGNIILFVAFEETPSADPWFTLNVAEQWAPGRKLDDRGLVIFVFMKEKRIRAEIGYGYETDLTDVKMRHVLEKTMVPLLREGRPMEAVEAAARELQQILTRLQGAEGRRSFFDEWPVYRREMARKADLIVRIWMASELSVRLIMSGLALLLWGWLVVLAVNLGRGVIAFALKVRQSMKDRDMGGCIRAVFVLVYPLMNAAFAVVLIFVVLTVGEHFFMGKGKFGGGGVNIFW